MIKGNNLGDRNNLYLTLHEADSIQKIATWDRKAGNL